MKKRTLHRTILTLALAAGIPAVRSQLNEKPVNLPAGLMLNLDLEHVHDRLIPNKALYPLSVPLGDLRIETVNYRKVIAIRHDQGLDVPHSLMLEPDGSEWIASARILSISPDGLVLSQGNDQFGYAIYLEDGAPRVAIRTGDSTLILEETEESGITDCRKEWVSIELRIKQDIALLTVNRKRAAMVNLQAPLQGDDMMIRLGRHSAVPAIMQHIPDASSDGFDGLIGSLKIWRQ